MDFGIGQTHSFIILTHGIHGWLLTRQGNWYVLLNALAFKRVDKGKILCWNPSSTGVLKLNVDSAPFDKI